MNNNLNNMYKLKCERGIICSSHISNDQAETLLWNGSFYSFFQNLYNHAFDSKLKTMELL